MSPIHQPDGVGGSRGAEGPQTTTIRVRKMEQLLTHHFEWTKHSVIHQRESRSHSGSGTHSTRPCTRDTQQDLLQRRNSGKRPEKEGTSPAYAGILTPTDSLAREAEERDSYQINKGNRNRREALTWISIFIANKKIGHDLTLSATFRYYTYLRVFVLKLHSV